MPRRYQSQQTKSNPHTKKQKNLKKSQLIEFQLISNELVGISIPYQIYDNQKKNIIKSLNGSWDHQSKNWYVKAGTENKIKQLMQAKFPQLGYSQIPQLAFRALKGFQSNLQIKKNKKQIIQILKYDQQSKQLKAQTLPFYNRLYDFQKKTLEFGVKNNGRILLADQMGVGKTIQSLALAYCYRNQWPLLIICPSSLKYNWQDQVLRWYQQIKQYQIQILNKSGTTVKPKTKILIVSYDIAQKQIQYFSKFNVVIADQAHYLKGFDTKRSANLIPFLKRRKRVILLTGTPAFAKPKELYNLLTIIRPDVFYNFVEFGNRYCDPKKSIWSNAIQYQGSKHAQQLNYILKNNLMIRRLKKQVLKQLPQKQRQKIILQTDNKIANEIGKIINNFSFQNLNQLFERGDDLQDNSLLEAYSMTGLAKISAIKSYIDEILQNDTKILIFAHHRNVLDELQIYTKEKQLGYIRIDGQVGSQERHRRVKQFQQTESIKVAILSVTAAGVGITLTASSTVIFAELHWTPAIMLQAEDRAHRIGQPSSVNCHYLVGAGTLDDFLYKRLQYKFNTVSKVLDGQNSTLEVQNLQKGQIGKVSKNNFKYKQQKKEQNLKRLSDYFIKKIQNKNTTEEKKEDISTNKGTQSEINKLDLHIDSSPDSDSDSQLILLLNMKKKSLIENPVDHSHIPKKQRQSERDV